MTADQYLHGILLREAVDAGPNSPLLGVQATLMPILRQWAAPVGCLSQRTATPQPILAGFLGFENTWKPATIGKYLSPVLAADQDEGRLDFGCIAAYGTFGCEGANCVSSAPHDKATTCFLLELITRLQRTGTAPAIDMTAYAPWLVREN